MLRSDAKAPDDQTVSPATAARVSLARAADQAFSLALRVNSIRQSRLDLADVVDQIDEDWALFPLLHDDGSVGVMCLEPACIIAFVETQTMGRVSAAVAEPRRLTQTDKALAVAFLEGFLRRFDEALKGAPTAYWTRGYHTEDAVATRHMMVLQLDGAEYRGFDMQSEVVEAERPINMRLFLPIKEKVAKQNARKKPTKTGVALLESEHTIRRSAMAAKVEMDAIMCKVMLPLSELNTLQPGHLVPLPQDAAKQAHLVDRSGRSAQSVRLGQLHGMRAIKVLHENEDPGMMEPGALDPSRPKASANGPKTSPERGAEVEIEEPVQEPQSIALAPVQQDEFDVLIQAGKDEGS